jgi:drug/metabolite transporter (DMT)-like permease
MKNNVLAVIFALIAVAMWSTVATAFKLSLEQMSLLQLLTGASFFSLIVLFITLLIRGELKAAFKTLPNSIRSVLFLSILNPVLYYIVLLEAYDLLPAQVAQSLNYTWAITLTLLSVPLLGHSLTRSDLAAIILGYIGVVFIAFSGKSISGELNYWGVFLALFSTLIWAGYWLLNARDKKPPITKLFQSFLLATPILLFILVIYEGFPNAINLKQLAGMVYIGFFEMGLAFICWQMAMHFTDKVSQVGTLIFLSPFISLFIINKFLGEPLSILTFIGLGLIISGILIQQFANSSIEISE